MPQSKPGVPQYAKGKAAERAAPRGVTVKVGLKVNRVGYPLDLDPRRRCSTRSASTCN
jgi:hypothetical protein